MAPWQLRPRLPSTPTAGSTCALGGTFYTAGSVNLTYNGIVAGSGVLNDTGTTGGFLVLGGVNTYTGGTTIAANNSSGLSISADTGPRASRTATPWFRP